MIWLVLVARSVMNEMNNNEMLEQDVATEEVCTVEEMIVKCGDLITEAVNSNNIDQLKGILQVCTLDAGISEEKLDELVKETMEGTYKDLSDEEIEKISGGVLPANILAKGVKGVAELPSRFATGGLPVLGALGAVAALGLAGVGFHKLYKKKKSGK